MKNYIFLLVIHICLVGCSKEPTKAQLEIVNQLIQEQIDIPYKEPNWTNPAKENLLKHGVTAKEVTERSKKLHDEIHDFFLALKDKPYNDKKEWAISYLEPTIELWEKTVKSSKKPLDKSDKGNREVILLFEKRKEWLAILKK